MRVFAKDVCLHQVSAIDINLKIFVSEGNETKIQFQRKKTYVFPTSTLLCAFTLLICGHDAGIIDIFWLAL